MNDNKKDGTKDLTSGEIAEKSRVGFMALSIRSIITNVLQIASSFLLAYFLTPLHYGEFGILNSFLGALLFFTDIGLSTHLQQRKEKITDKELSVFFTIRILLSSFLFTAFVFIAPLLATKYHFESSFANYFGILAIILPLEAIGSLPKIILQRELNFKIIAKIDMVSSIVLYTSQILLAYLGYGVWSFIIAMILRSLVSAVTSYIYHPKFIMPSLNFSIFEKSIYKKGFLYQLNSIIPTSRGIFLPMLMTIYLDVDSIGLIFWVTGLVSIPMVFAYNYNNVFFPALSKVQGQEDEARHLASRAIENMLLALSYLFGLGAILGPAIIENVFPDKWAAAKDLVPIAALYIGISAIRFLGTSIINAQGKPYVLTKIELFLVTSEYLGVIIFCSWLGPKGYFISQSIVYFLCLALVYLNIKDWIRKQTVRRFIICSFASGLPYFLASYFSLLDNLILSFILHIIIFLPIVVLFDKDSLPDIKKLANKIGIRF